jgi:hypothetical protein
MKLLGLSFVMLLTMGWTGGCSSPAHPPIEELLIDISVFPKGWITSAAGPRPLASAPLGGNKSVDNIALGFYAPGGSAFHEIQRFKNTRQAENEFAKKREQVFRVTEFRTPWEVPDELAYESSVADEFHYACSLGVGASWPHCAYIARYDAYYVLFYAHMISGYISYADLENILEAIDERMAVHGIGQAND